MPRKPARTIDEVLDHLRAEADATSGVVSGFTVRRCMDELGFGPSGAFTLPRYLEALVERGEIEYSPRRGQARSGYLRVTGIARPRDGRAIHDATGFARPSVDARIAAVGARNGTARVEPDNARPMVGARNGIARPPRPHPSPPAGSSSARVSAAEFGERGSLSSSSRGEEEDLSLPESVRPVWDAYCRLAEQRRCTPHRPKAKTVRDLAELTDKFGAASVVATLEFALTWPRSKWVQVILPNGLRELVARYDRIRLMKEQEDRQAAAPTYHSRRPAMIEAPTGLGSRVISL